MDPSDNNFINYYLDESAKCSRYKLQASTNCFADYKELSLENISRETLGVLLTLVLSTILCHNENMRPRFIVPVLVAWILILILANRTFTAVGLIISFMIWFKFKDSRM